MSQKTYYKCTVKENAIQVYFVDIIYTACVKQYSSKTLWLYEILAKRFFLIKVNQLIWWRA